MAKSEQNSPEASRINHIKPFWNSNTTFHGLKGEKQKQMGFSVWMFLPSFMEGSIKTLSAMTADFSAERNVQSGSIQDSRPRSASQFQVSRSISYAICIRFNSLSIEYIKLFSFLINTSRSAVFA